jgi:hypothetical protein
MLHCNKWRGVFYAGGNYFAVGRRYYFAVERRYYFAVERRYYFAVGRRGASNRSNGAGSLPAVAFSSQG